MNSNSKKKNHLVKKKKTVETGDVYSEYYGFVNVGSPPSKTHKVATSESKSKGKKIVFSKRNVHLKS